MSGVRNTYRIITIFFCCLSIGSFSQNSAYINYGANEGLNHGQIIDMTQDDMDNFWILPYASSNMYRFDGVNFKRYLIKVKGIDMIIRPHHLVADKNKRILIITNIGLVEFNGSEFRLIPSQQPIKVTDNPVLFLDSNSTPWTIDKDGVAFFQSPDSKKMEKKEITAGGSAKGFFEYNGEVLMHTSRMEIFSMKTNQRVSLPWINTTDFYKITRDGNQYFIFGSNRITSFNIENNKRVEIPVNGHSLNSFSEIFADGEDFWLLNRGSLNKINQQGIHKADVPEDLSRLFIHKIFRDKDGFLWFCSDINGIFRYLPNLSFTKYLDGLPTGSIWPVDKENIFFGTSRYGLRILKEGAVIENPFPRIGKFTVPSIIGGPRSSIIVTTLGNGAFRMEGSSVKEIKLDVNSKGSLNIFSAHYGEKDIWLVSMDAIYRLDTLFKPVKTYRPLDDLGITGDVNFVRSLDASKLLIGTSENGLLVLNISNDSVKEVSNFEKFSSLYCIERDSLKRIWLGGEFPFLVVLDSSLNIEKEIDLSAYCSNVLDVNVLNENELLIGSTDGIFRLAIDRNFRIMSAKKFTKIDGYDGSEIYVGSMMKFKDEVWFGTSGGVYKYAYTRPDSISKPPNTYITQIELPEDSTKYSFEKPEGLYETPGNLKLKYGHTNLLISFFASNSTSAGKMTYRHYLEGAESAWSDYSASSQISFSNLPPGKYRFHLQSRTELMKEGSTVEFPFEVTPAFWQTLGFRIIAGILAIIFAFSIIRYLSLKRLHQYRLTEKIRVTEIGKLRRQMAMDFHDEMGNKLAGILAYINTLKVRKTHVQTEDLINYLEENATAVYHGTKDFIWSIDVESNNLREVINYVRDFGVIFFERHDINFIVETDIMSGAFGRSLADGYNRHIILLFKEAMTNILKHAKCSTVYFDAMMIGNRCKIILEDDGIGLQESNEGKGLKSMKNRAKKLNGTVLFENKKPHGTRVVLEFEIAK